MDARVSASPAGIGGWILSSSLNNVEECVPATGEAKACKKAPKTLAIQSGNIYLE